MIAFWLSTALAWTCVEATHVYANAATRSFGEKLVTDGWSYSPEQLACMERGGVMRNTIERRQLAQGTPVKVERAGPMSTVVLDLGCGTVRVRGTDADRLTLEGTQDGDPPEIEVTGEIVTARIAAATRACGVLDVTAPRTARLLVYHRGRHVRVLGMEGAVEVQALQADVEVIGSTDVVEIESMRGDIYVDGGRSVQVSGGEGIVAIGAADESTVRVTTVSGSVFVWGGPLRRMEVSTVGGDIRSQAALLPAAVVDARSQNGDVLVGVGPAQLAEMPGVDAAPSTLLHGTPSGSVRPDRVLPTGEVPSYAVFERLPVQVRALWSDEDARGTLWPATGARVRALQPLPDTTARVVVDSLTGTARATALPATIPRSAGAVLPRLEDHLPSLKGCRPDLAEPVMHPDIDLRATIRYVDGVPKEVTFDTEGFDPAITRCVAQKMTGWTVKDRGVLEVDWPLKLRRVRSEPSPP